MGRIELVVDRTRYSIVLIALLAVSCGQGAQGSGSDASFVPVENPTNEHAWQLFQQAKHEESMREYKSVLLKDDKDANAHYGVACNLDSLGKYEEALAEWRERMLPNDPSARKRWADRAEIAAVARASWVWPSPTETPPRAEIVEGGAYWG